MMSSTARRMGSVVVLAATVLLLAAPWASGDMDYYVRLGWGSGDGSGDSWANALPSISDAWAQITASGSYNLYIEKTTGAAAHDFVRPSGSTWYLDDMNVSHYGGLTPTDTGTGWTKSAGDSTRVEATTDVPAFQVSQYVGVGSYYMDRLDLRFDDMVIQGGETSGAILCDAVSGQHSPVSLTANRTHFLSGAGNTANPTIGYSTLDGRASASNVTLNFESSIIEGGNGGIKALAKSGGSNSGDAIFTLNNTVFLNTGDYGLYAKGNTYASWNRNAVVRLNNVTFNGTETAVQLGLAADPNILNSEHVLYYLNSATGVLFANEDEEIATISGSANAAFGYLLKAAGGATVDLTGFQTVADDTSGNPNLAADGYHLQAGSDARLIDAYTTQATGPFNDIDGDGRPFLGLGEVGVDEINGSPVPPYSGYGSFYIDFNESNGGTGDAAAQDTSRNWAVMTGNGTATPLIDDDNELTNFAVTTSGWRDSGTFSAGEGYSAPDDWVVHAASGDYLYVQDAETGTIKLKDLDPDLIYTIELVACRASSGNRDGMYVVTDGTGPHDSDSGNSVDFDAYVDGSQADELMVFSGLVPDANNEITVTVTRATDDSGTDYTYVSAMRITTTPEPATVGLLALGVLPLLRRRRR